jgi:hypothetical protein
MSSLKYIFELLHFLFCIVFCGLSVNELMPDAQCRDNLTEIAMLSDKNLILA